MLFAAFSGFIAAFLIQGAAQVLSLLPGDPQSRLFFLAILLLAGFGVTAGLSNWVGEKGGGKRPYDGLGDLFFQVHEPLLPDSSERWGFRAFSSFFLGISTLFTGLEGAAIEAIQSLAIRIRPRSSRWFDLRRRSDVAISLAAGTAAFFHAPVAGAVLAIEWAVGGRTMQAVLAALVGATTSQILSRLPGGLRIGQLAPEVSTQLRSLSVTPETVGVLLGVGLFCALVGIAIIRWSDWSERRVEALTREKDLFRGLLGLLGMVAFIYALPEIGTPSFAWISKWSGVDVTYPPVSALMKKSTWLSMGAGGALLLGMGFCLAISWCLATFGGAGVISPVFVAGSLLGTAVSLYLSEPAGGAALALFAAVFGGATLCGTVLGVPYAAAVLACEITGDYLYFLPALALTLLGHELRVRSRTLSLPELEAARRGLVIHGGRSTRILESIAVKDAMTTEVECFRDHEPILNLIQRMESLHHPFFPVIDHQGKFIGMTTLDDVMDAHDQTGGRSSETSGALGGLLEVKDLLYRAGWRSPTVLASQPLSTVQELFEETPCLPVLNDERRVVGLLFVHQVRLAYDREVGRRTLGLRSSG
jgi:H+/Cl- antiporter ClcA